MGFVSILLESTFINALHLCKTVLLNKTIELGPRNSQLDCLRIRSKDLFFRPDLKQDQNVLFSRLVMRMECSR